MTVEETTKMIMKTLADLQAASGRACGELTAETKPIGDLAGFDSLSAIEATVAIEAALGVELTSDNVLVSEIAGRKRALTIGQAAQRIVNALDTAAV